jgi:ATP synthase subunit 6
MLIGLFSPLEQFQILPIIAGWSYNLSLTNQTLILICTLGFFILSQILILGKNGKTYLVPGRVQTLMESLNLIVLTILKDNLGKNGLKYFPFIFVVCLVVLYSNLLGLVPYSFTTTSHLILTFSLALAGFVGIVIVAGQLHGIHGFAHFIPTGTGLALSFLLVPIEVVSFFFKPLSLGVRLFANIIAGHTLLKVIGGFSWTIMKKGGILFYAHFIPLFVLVLLIGLELGVGLIQTYVFVILLCIYFREGINLH